MAPQSGDELCEIEGIGPVSVAAATELLSEGGFQYLVKEGFDIKTVTKSTRVIANCIDMALVARDRVCARPGCGNSPRARTRPLAARLRQRRPERARQLGALVPRVSPAQDRRRLAPRRRPGSWRWVAPAKPPSAGRSGPDPQGGRGQGGKGQGVREEGPERAQADVSAGVSGAGLRRRGREHLCSAARRAPGVVGFARAAVVRVTLSFAHPHGTSEIDFWFGASARSLALRFTRPDDVDRPNGALRQRIFRFTAPLVLHRVPSPLKGPRIH